MADMEDFYEDGLIAEKDFNFIQSSIQKTNYMISRYIDSLVKLDKAGKWKKSFH